MSENQEIIEVIEESGAIQSGLNSQFELSKAYAEGINALRESDFNKIKVLTRLSQKKISLLISVYENSKWLKKNGIDDGAQPICESYVTFMISEGGQARAEIVRVLESGKDSPKSLKDRATSAILGR